jgi:hypothetical protein
MKFDIDFFSKMFGETWSLILNFFLNLWGNMVWYWFFSKISGETWSLILIFFSKICRGNMKFDMDFFFQNVWGKLKPC